MIFFISDLHLGHKSILKFQPNRPATDLKEHSRWLVKQWNSVVGKQDVTYLLGDICFSKKHLVYFRQMRGQKHLILGNHDTLSLKQFAPYFNTIHGFKKVAGFWLSHCPLHPDSLSASKNIHGHIHTGVVMLGDKPDPRYINVNVDHLNGIPLSLDIIKRSLDEGMVE